MFSEDWCVDVSRLFRNVQNLRHAPPNQVPYLLPGQCAILVSPVHEPDHFVGPFSKYGRLVGPKIAILAEG